MAIGFKPDSLPTVVGGCFILFCDWLFFNAGSSWSLTQDKETNLPALSMMNTIISAAGSCTAYAVYQIFKEFYNECHKNEIIQNITLKYDVISFVGVIMSGCVSVTASCNNVDTFSAMLIGVVGAAVYESSVILLTKFQIDDPLQVTQIHGFCGVWGAIAQGLFDKDSGLFITGRFN